MNTSHGYSDSVTFADQPSGRKGSSDATALISELQDRKSKSFSLQNRELLSK